MSTQEQAGANVCRYCGAPLSDGAASGLCLRCALGNALESPGKTIPVPFPSEEHRGISGNGDTIGRYKLLEKVGEGGCGVVYVAEQTEPVRRRVALKVIKLGMDTRAVVARFEAERQALAMLDHPNIAKVLDAGTTETGRPYFVMELVRGIKITDYCDENNLSTRDRLDLFIKVCHAIQHAHQKGIIHRDIKPSNILVTLHDGVPVPKVIDFGIAKATEGKLTDATVYTQLHQLIGTPAYMSPEQAEMSGLDIDTRSDIYSLGVLLYELLVGTTPFDARELMSQGIDAMRRTIREKEPQRPSTRLATLRDEDLTTTAKRRSAEAPRLIHLLRGDPDWIVMKCLEKDRARRYETANGLAMDLQRYLNNEPVVARPPSAAYRFQKAFRRNKLAFSAAGAVAAALLIGMAVSTWQSLVARKAQRETELARKDERKQRVEAQQKQIEAESERQRAQLEKQRADAQAQKASESQKQFRRFLYDSDMNLAQQAIKLNNLGKARRLLDRHRPQPGEEDLRGWEWRYLWQLTRNSALVTLTNETGFGFSVSFSPDGRSLAVGLYDGRVELWDVAGRRLVRALSAQDYSQQGRVAFSPVRNLLAATSGTKTIALYDLDSGRESTLWRAPDSGAWVVRDLSFSQDGSKVVIYAGYPANLSSAPNPGSEDCVYVLDVATAAIEFRQKSGYASTFHFGAARLSPDNRRLYLARGDSLNYSYSLQCFDPGTGQELWQTEVQRDYGVTTLAVSPDGRLLASGSGFEDPNIRIWDAARGRLLLQLQGHSAWVSHLAFSNDGRGLVSAASDQTIRVWDTGTWTEKRVLRGHSDEVYTVAISDSAQLLASSGKDGNLMLWKEDGTKAIDGYSRLPDHLRAGEVVPLTDSSLLFLPGGEAPQLGQLALFQGPLPFKGISEDVLGVFGTNILCCWEAPGQIVVYELLRGQFVKLGSLPLDSKSRPTGFAYCSDHRLMAWTEGASSAPVFVANLDAPGRRVELRGDVPGLIPFHFSPDGKYLNAVARNPNDPQSWSALRVWNLDSGQIVVSVDGLIRDATFAVAGRVLAMELTEGQDHEIRFYDLAQPSQAPRPVPGKGDSFCLAASPDGTLVAASTSKGEVLLFDPLKGELLDSLHGHLHGVFALAFSPDGRRLISASGGAEAVKVWDVGARQEVLTLGGTGSLFLAARWSADGNTIVAGAPWQTWHAPTWEEIAAAEAGNGFMGSR